MNVRKSSIFTAVVTALLALTVFAAVAVAATITGDDTNEQLIGTNNGDTINALGGNDLVIARGGNDTVDGGVGNDKLFGQRGDDTQNGGDGNDVLHGGWGDDTQHGGAGDDIIFAGVGVDESFGDDGNDKLWALARRDVSGRDDTKTDTLHGGNGDDTFRTRDGEADVIDCGEGNDTAYLDFKDKILDATADKPNGSCEKVLRKKRAIKDHQELS
ncbi:MAG: calcium-binding protein [Solirubrobacterales bacterium]